MRTHILEVSEAASSIAEHDLSDLVVPAFTPAYEQEQHQASRTASSSAGYFPVVHSGASTPWNEDAVARPPRAIVYAASTAGHSSSTNTSQHPVSLIPTVSPPRYQLSLSHPGSPPSRNVNHAARRGESYPPEARRAPPSPPLSQFSAPTILQGQYSIAGYDASWHSEPASRAASNPEGNMARRDMRSGRYSLPEYDEEEHGQEPLAPVSNEQHARITAEQYRLGVGYDEHIPGTTGKRISDQRRLERLKALEKEFGRGKNENRSISWAPSPGANDSEAARKISSKSAKHDVEKGQSQVDGEGYDGEGLSEKMTFKQMRIKEKEEKARLNRELGITKDGNLLTQGRKTRLALRWTQGLLGLVAVISGLGGAFFTNPPEDEEPPPSGAISTWFLYIIALASLICTLYLFTVQPCVRRSKAKKSLSDDAAHLATGAMPNGIVLPIFSSSHAYNALANGSGKKGAFGKKKNKKKGYRMQQQHQPMMVNLVVDPSMLGGGANSKPPSRYDDSGFDEEDEEHSTNLRGANNLAAIGEEGDEEGEEDDHDFHIPDSRLKAEQARKRRMNQPYARMMDTMSIMKLQDKWREARRRMRKMAWIDAAWAIVWFAEALFAIGFGKSCKPGSAAGWCDTYNMALASAVLLAVAFSASCVYDILDLRRSRSTPRLSRTI